MSTARIEQLALAAKAGVDGGFDRGRGGAHFGDRLHALQHVFGESRIAGRDLQLGLAGDAIDGLVEGLEHGLVGGVHADEQRPRRARCRRW